MSLPDIETIWNVSEHNFNDIALQLFQYQVKNNPVYAQYVKLLDKRPHSIAHYSQIPFLPIAFFKTHKIISGPQQTDFYFESSSTTGLNTSKHFVPDVALYHANAKCIFESRFGNLADYTFYGLLPNYLERQNSSLVSMVDFFMRENKQSNSFFLYNHSDLYTKLTQPSIKKKLLFGVSFALLDFADHFSLKDLEFTIIETGGMKGRKKEMTKDEVYHQLKNAFPKATILSEYGMTELLSQAYSNELARYTCPAWMKVLVRNDSDPFTLQQNEKTGALNIIDLANVHSCAFIATDDLGKRYNDQSFEVLGRLDNADIRGCSLMV